MDNKKQKNVGEGDRVNIHGPSNQHAKELLNIHNVPNEKGGM